MRRLIIIFVQIILCILTVKAQLYLNTFTGYSLSQNTDKEISIEIINNIENTYAYTFKNGEGLNLGIGVGYQISKNLSVEANCNTQLFTTQKITIPSSIDYVSNIHFFCRSGFFGSLNYRHEIFQLSPQLKYRVNYNKILFYVKIGPNFLWAKTYISEHYKDITSSQANWGMDFIDVENQRYKEGKCNIGIQSSIGLEYPILSKMTLFGEIISVNSNYIYDKLTLQSYVIDGVNQINESTQTTFDLTSKEKTNYSQIGLNVGVKYAF